MAVGSTENRIQIHTSTTQGSIHVCSGISEPEKYLTVFKTQFAKALSLEGHSDWVRSLTFITPRPIDSPNSVIDYQILPGELLMASGSQDNYIRLWRFSRLSFASEMPASTGLEGLDELERTLAEAEGGDDGELRVKAHDFRVEGDGGFSCSAEAVLLGHDAWVTGLHWAPLYHSTSIASTSNPIPQTLQLLSSSADRSMILWTPSDADNSTDSIWTSSRRFGEFSSATNLGFFGALWGVDSKTVLAHGWGGSWHVWREENGDWNPVIATGGHFSGVKSVAWEPKGEFLLSAG